MGGASTGSLPGGAARGKGGWRALSRAPTVCIMDDRAERLVLRVELEDKIQVMEKDLRRHTWNFRALLAAAAVFFVMGVLYGTPGHVAGVFLCMASLVPLTRQMTKADEIRRARNELQRMLTSGGSDREDPRLKA